MCEGPKQKLWHTNTTIVLILKNKTENHLSQANCGKNCRFVYEKTQEML